MKNALRNLFLACLAIGLCTGSVWAALLDYSDTPLGYSVASNGTGRYQRLGTAWSNEAGPLYNNGDNDDGVQWRMGSGAYGNDPITSYGIIDFEFFFHKGDLGNHPFDRLGVWLDLNKNGSFEDAGEYIYFYDWYNPIGVTSNIDITRTLSYNIDPAVFATPGDLWLGARVTCSTSFTDPAKGGVWDSSHYLEQGETEDWNLASVPEPSTLLLLGTGLLGLAGIVRKKTKK